MKGMDASKRLLAMGRVVAGPTASESSVMLTFRRLLASDAAAGVGHRFQPAFRDRLAAPLAAAISAVVEAIQRLGDGAEDQLLAFQQANRDLLLEGMRWRKSCHGREKGCELF